MTEPARFGACTATVERVTERVYKLIMYGFDLPWS